MSIFGKSKCLICVSITWNDQDQKRVEEDFCEGCKTKGLRLMIGGLVEKLVKGNN